MNYLILAGLLLTGVGTTILLHWRYSRHHSMYIKYFDRGFLLFVLGVLLLGLAVLLS